MVRLPERIDTEQVKEELGAELLRLHAESYGKGAAEARVYFEEDVVLCMLDRLELLPSEEFLIENGQGDGVVEVRGRYQRAVETTYRAAVERITGRRVVSFASVTKIDPNYAVEIFRLAPQAEIPLEEPEGG